jgi:anaerobic magnesium-protoporphyrin IX monomethyl ester cyclase
MKIVLVNPLWSFRNELPINLAELAGYIREYGDFHVSLIDLNHELKKYINSDNIIEKAVEIVKAQNPDIIGITCNTIHVPFCVEFCKAYKSKYKVPLVLGGIHPTFRPDRMFKLTGADYIIRGEGEETALELLNAIKQKSEVNEIKGLSYRCNNKIYHNCDRPFIEDLTKLPFPAFDLLPPKDKRDKAPRVCICASRGCPYGCIFCSASRMWGYQRRKPIERIVKEIKYLKKKYKCGHIEFWDDCLPLNKVWFNDLLSEVRKLKINWSCLSRVDILDYNLLKRMKDAGCSEIYHGIESGSPRIRKLLEKKLKPKVNNAGITGLVRKEISLGIRSACSFMVGVPTETKEEIRATIDFAYKLKEAGAMIQLWIMTPYLDTKAVRLYKHNLVKVDRWKIIRQSDVNQLDQLYLYSEFYERYYKDNPDFYMFKPDMEMKEFLKIYEEGRIKLGLQVHRGGRLYNYIEEKGNKKYFIGIDRKFRLENMNNSDRALLNLTPKTCEDCYKLFKVTRNGEIELCTGKKLFKNYYTDDRSLVYILYLKMGILGLGQQRVKPLCPHFPKDKKIFQLLLKRYYRSLQYIDKAEKYFHKRNVKKCIEYVFKAMRLGCKYDIIHFLLGFCYEKNKKYKKALTELKIAERIYPKDIRINISLLKCYKKMGKIKESDREFLRIYYKFKNYGKKLPEKTDNLASDEAEVLDGELADHGSIVPKPRTI